MINKSHLLKEGSIISESSHYIVENILGSTATLIHFESGQQVQISTAYLASYTNSADLYDNEVKVGKEDKKDGTLGIRSIWENIHSGQAYSLYALRNKISLNLRRNLMLKYLV